LITFAKILVSTTLVFIIFAREGFQDILRQLTSANLFWILAAMIVFSVSNFLGSFQWFLLLKARGIKLPYLKVLSFYYVGLFFNNLLVGYIGGDAVRIYDVRKYTGDSSKAISTVVFDRFIGFVLLTTFALFGALFWQNMLQSQTVLLSILLIFISWVLFFLILFNETFARKVGFLLKHFLPEKFNVKLKEIYTNLNSFKDSKRLLINIFFISLCVQFLRIFVHYLAALSVGLHGQFKYFLIFIPIIALLASLPISIGGIGIRESGGLALFSNIPAFVPEMVVAMEFLAFLVGFISAMPGGVLFMLRKEKLNLN
jgi:glycosyltransferase 2 family protein